MYGFGVLLRGELGNCRRGITGMEPLYRSFLLNFLLSKPRSAVTYTLAGTLGIMGITALWSLSPPFPISKLWIWLCSLHKAVILLDLNFPAFEILSPPFCNPNSRINVGRNLGSILASGLSEEAVKYLGLFPELETPVNGGFWWILTRQHFPLAARFCTYNTASKHSLSRLLGLPICCSGKNL